MIKILQYKKDQEHSHIYSYLSHCAFTASVEVLVLHSIIKWLTLNCVLLSHSCHRPFLATSLYKVQTNSLNRNDSKYLLTIRMIMALKVFLDLMKTPFFHWSKNHHLSLISWVNAEGT